MWPTAVFKIHFGISFSSGGKLVKSGGAAGSSGSSGKGGVVQRKDHGRDWGTGIEQKKFRVASPTFFSNPNINIPGLMNDEDEDEFDSDDDFDDDDFFSNVGSDDELERRLSKKKKKKGEEVEVETGPGADSAVSRIEFRGNQVREIRRSLFRNINLAYLITNPTFFSG